MEVGVEWMSSMLGDFLDAAKTVSVDGDINGGMDCADSFV
jgi:hypothetical protein